MNLPDHCDQDNCTTLPQSFSRISHCQQSDFAAL